MSSGPESMTPPGEDWAAIEQRLDRAIARRRRRQQNDDDSFFADVVGRAEGGLAIRDGAPDGPIIVLDRDEVASYCGSRLRAGRTAALFDDPGPPFPADRI